MDELFAEGLEITPIAENDQWGMDRNDGIGGSEAGAVLGLNKYTSALDLLEEKVTRTSLRAFTEAQELRMAVGHAQESLVLKNFATKELGLPYTTSLDVLDATDALGHLSDFLFVNPRFRFAFAHVDGLYRLDDELGVVDAKVTFRSSWPEVPQYYIAQLAHYNAVLGSNVGYIAAMFQDHPYPVPVQYRFDFTPDQLMTVMRAERNFWKYVTNIRQGVEVSDTELEGLQNHLSALGEEFMSGIDTNPGVGGSEAVTVVVAGEGVDLLIRYAELKEQAKLLYSEIDSISEYFKVDSSDNVSFVLPDGTELAKKTTTGVKGLDRDAMAEAGVPIDRFFTTKPQTRFTTTKALSGISKGSIPRAKDHDAVAEVLSVRSRRAW